MRKLLNLRSGKPGKALININYNIIQGKFSWKFMSIYSRLIVQCGKVNEKFLELKLNYRKKGISVFQEE